MTTTPSTGSSLPGSDRWEWWEQQQWRRQLREAAHPERAPVTARTRVIVSWTALAAVLIVCLMDAGVRAAAVAFAGVALLFILTFAITRTRTLSWRAAAFVFTAAVVWGLAVAAVAPLTRSVLSDDALLLAPLPLAVIAVPGRIRRFAVMDWLLVAASLGLGYQAVEATARALAAHLGANLSANLSDAAPAGGLGGRFVPFALVGLTLGTGIAISRHGWRLTGPAALSCRIGGGILPFLGLAVLIGAHLPATGDLPSGLAALRAAGSNGPLLTVAVLVLIIAGLMLDTRRIRATDEPGTDRLPFPFSASNTADAWTLAITGPGNSGPGAAFFYSLTAGVWAVCCMITYTVRDLLVVLGAHVRIPEEPLGQAISRGRAAATLTRVLRAAAFSQFDPAEGNGRREARTAGAGVLVFLLVAGALLAGLGADAPVQWLGEAKAAVGQGSQAMGSGGRIAAVVALTGLLILITGVSGTALTPSGTRRLLIDNGRGAITFAPGGTVTERLQTRTVPELVLDAITAAITLIPAGVVRAVARSAAGGPARAVVAEFCADPARMIARRKRQLSSGPEDTGAMLAVRTGTWDAASRRRWVDSRVSSQAYRISSADGRTSVPADGLAITSDDVAMLEATHLHRMGAPMLYEGGAPSLLAERLLAPFDDEMRRYATVIRDPHNPVGRLRLVVGSDRANVVLGGRARQILGPDIDMFIVIDPVDPIDPINWAGA